MNPNDRPEELSPDGGSPTSRREFLHQVAGATAAATVASQTAHGQADPEAGTRPDLLPTIQLGNHSITRLILGGNPIYGHSHFNRLYSQFLRDYHTPERVVDLLRACESAGINAWQNSYEPRTVADVELCRREGIRFDWLLLGKPDWDRQPEIIDAVAKRKPLGIAPHGSLCERLRRAGRLDTLLDLLKRIRQTGVLVGLSAHDPTLIELAEEKDWDVDYYMVALYYLTRPRDELTGVVGEVPLGEIYLPSDRDRAFRAIRQVRKPCLAYKVLAAGRANLSPAGIRRTFQETLSAIKPTDAMIIGMFQQFDDQVGVNARFVRELA